MDAQCESCLYFEEDELTGEPVCSVTLDEDEYERFTRKKHIVCPYYRNGDEYALVRKQN